MPSSVNIRNMELNDFDQVICLAAEAHKESSYAHLDFDIHVVYEMARVWVINPEIYFCKLAESENNKIFAMYVGYISSYYFGKDLVALDCLLYVDQSKRGGLAAVRLIKEFEKWAFANGAKEIRPASSTGVKTEETRKLYEALGYDTIGNTFVKRR